MCVCVCVCVCVLASFEKYQTLKDDVINESVSWMHTMSAMLKHWSWFSYSLNTLTKEMIFILKYLLQLHVHDLSRLGVVLG